jgi:hypothetical protein
MSKFIVLIIAFVSLPLFAGEWRTPNVSKDILEIRKKGADLNGNFVGFSGKVAQVEVGYQDKPLFVLEVSDKYGKESLVIGSLLKADLAVGDMLEVFGDVIPIQSEDEKAKKLTSDKFMVLGLCIVNSTKAYAQGAEPAQELCNKWYLKEFPEKY